MHTLSLRAVRGAALLALALSSWVGVHAKTPVKPAVVPVHGVKPVATKATSTPRVQPAPAPAPSGSAVRESVAVDSDGSRFRYDSCGCSNER